MVEQQVITPDNDKVQEAIDNLKELTDMEHVLKDNEIEFSYQGDHYKIKKPNFKEASLILEHKTKVLSNLIKDPDSLYESQIRKTLKGKGLDLDAIDKNIDSLITKKKTLQRKLAELLSVKDNKIKLDAVKEQILGIDAEVNSLATNRNSYLDCSIETRLEYNIMVFRANILCYIKKDNEYVKRFSSLQDMDTLDMELFHTILMKSCLLTRHSELC